MEGRGKQREKGREGAGRERESTAGDRLSKDQMLAKVLIRKKNF